MPSVKLFCAVPEKLVQARLVAAIVEVFGQGHAIARVLTDKRVFGQEPVQKKYACGNDQIKKEFEKFKHRLPVSFYIS